MYLTFSSLVKGLKQLHCDEYPSLECCWNESLNLEMNSLVLKSMVTLLNKTWRYQYVLLVTARLFCDNPKNNWKPLTRAMLTSGIALKKKKSHPCSNMEFAVMWPSSSHRSVFFVWRLYQEPSGFFVPCALEPLTVNQNFAHLYLYSKTQSRERVACMFLYREAMTLPSSWKRYQNILATFLLHFFEVQIPKWNVSFDDNWQINDGWLMISKDWV